jgi:hypothetical protein
MHISRNALTPDPKTVLALSIAPFVRSPMITICRTAFVVLCVLIPTVVSADGLIYQLPGDGTWVRFDLEGKLPGPDGTEVTMIGSVTLSSVGTAEVDGEPCRWIEVASETKRKDGQPVTDVNKLLIPEKNLGKGKDPLEHVLKAWHKNSMVAGGTPQQIEDLKAPGARYLNNVRPYLHGPSKTAEKLGNVAIKSKLGELECEGTTGNQKIDDTLSMLSYDYTYTIRLHDMAPFGVVTWEAKTKMELDGQSLGTVTTKMKLSDFGKDAKSVLPNSK